jgi:hypothetical protein
MNDTFMHKQIEVAERLLFTAALFIATIMQGYLPE